MEWTAQVINFDRLILLFIKDINECNTDNGGCEENCQNNIGTYSCFCLTGYLIDTNGHNCTGLQYFFKIM